MLVKIGNWSIDRLFCEQGLAVVRDLARECGLKPSETVFYTLFEMHTMHMFAFFFSLPFML